MSYATGTTHYNLPQTVGSDKRDWTDTNQAFSDLDTAVYGAAQGAEAATSAIQTINSELDVIAGKQATDEENITTLNGKVSTLESTTSTLGAEVLDVRQDLQDNIESKHEASATSTHAYAIGDTFYYNDILYKATAAIAIGDTIVPTVNCMGITVMSQVSAINDDLSDQGEKFRFGVDPVSGDYGYYKEEGGADTFIPFSSRGGGGLSNVKLITSEIGSISSSKFIIPSGTTPQTFIFTVSGGNDTYRKIESYSANLTYSRLFGGANYPTVIDLVTIENTLTENAEITLSDLYSAENVAILGYSLT